MIINPGDIPELLAIAGLQTGRGTFTPTIEIGGASTGITYAAQNGRFMRVGRLVNVDLEIVLTSKGALTGNLAIGGLPYPVNAQAIGSAGNIAFYSGMSTINGMIIGQFEPGQSVMTLYDRQASTANNLVDTNLSNTSKLVLSGVYEI